MKNDNFVEEDLFPTDFSLNYMNILHKITSICFKLSPGVRSRIRNIGRTGVSDWNSPKLNRSFLTTYVFPSKYKGVNSGRKGVK